ncbi:MAG: subfamily polymerase sigma-24 factor [Bacillota bacterium]|nr:subfamily polymerase sigma-24 factor [Bacillota bacterium]
MNESELIIRIQNGDADSFGRIFDRYKAKAVRTAYLITGNQATAEDVAQEAFVKCYLEIRGLRDPERFKTWFYRLLVRTAWRYSKLENRNIPVSDLPEKGDSNREISSEQMYLQQEMSELLYRQIHRLDEKKRTAVMLYYYGELSTKEIAEVMGCLEGTVKSRLYFARKILKNNLERLNVKGEEYYGKAGYESGH